MVTDTLGTYSKRGYDSLEVTTEEDVCLHLCALLQEVLGVAQLEVVVVIVGLRTETDLLDYDLHGFGLDLLSLTLLLIQELLIVGDTAHRGIGLGRNLEQVELHLVGQLDSLANREHDGIFDIVAYDAYLRCSDLVIDAMRILLLGATWPVGTLATVLRACVVCPRRKWFCSVYSFVLLLVNKTLIY